jgi:hypothetical protein
MQDDRIPLLEAVEVIERFSPLAEKIFADHLKEPHIGAVIEDMTVMRDPKTGATAEIGNP